MGTMEREQNADRKVVLEKSAQSLLRKSIDCLDLAQSQQNLANKTHELSAEQRENADRQHELAAKQDSTANKLDENAKKLETMGHALEASAMETMGDTMGCAARARIGIREAL
jgi:hypothetical protein